MEEYSYIISSITPHAGRPLIFRKWEENGIEPIVERPIIIPYSHDLAVFVTITPREG